MRLYLSVILTSLISAGCSVNVDLNNEVNNQISDELLEAIRNGEVAEVEEILADGVNPDEVNSTDEGRNTPLIIAILERQDEIAKSLLTNPDLNINAQNKEGNTALMEAVKAGNREIVELILEIPEVDLAILNEAGEDVFNLAEQGGFEEISNLLQEAVIDKTPNQDTTISLDTPTDPVDSQAPVVVATDPESPVTKTENQDTTIVTDSPVDPQVPEPLDTSVIKTDNQDTTTVLDTPGLEVTKDEELNYEFVEKDPAVNTNTQKEQEVETILKEVLEQEETEVKNKEDEIVIQDPGEDFVQDETPKKVVPIKTIEMENTIKPSETSTPAVRTIQITEPDPAQDFVHDTTKTFLKERGEVEIKPLVYEDPFSTNTSDQYGNTELHTATKEGDYDLVNRILLNPNVDINLQNKDKETPLIIASSKGYESIVILLLKRNGVDVNAQDKWGKTALMAAAGGGYLNIVDLLLVRPDIDVNLTLHLQKETALHQAVYKNHLAIVKSLLAHENIDIYIRDYLGTSITDHAHRINSKKLIALIEEYESKREEE